MIQGLLVIHPAAVLAPTLHVQDPGRVRCNGLKCARLQVENVHGAMFVVRADDTHEREE